MQRGKKQKGLTMKAKILRALKSTNFRRFLYYFALVFVTFCGFLNQTLINDNAGRMDYYDETSLDNFLKDPATSNNGRWGNVFYYLIHKPLSGLGFTYEHNQWIYFLIDMIVIAIALAILYSVFFKLIKPNKQGKIVLFLAIALIAVNPFMVESLAFMLPSHPQALLFTALAIHFLVGKRKLHYLWSILFTTASILTYQSYYAHLIILGALALYFQNKGAINKKLAISIAKVIGIVAIGMAAYFISVKLYCRFTGQQAAKGTALSLSPILLAKQLFHVLEVSYFELARGSGIYHTYGLLTAVLIITACLPIIRPIREKCLRTTVFTAIFAIVALILPVAYGVISTEFYVAPRTLVAFFTVISGFILLTLYQKPNLKVNNAISIALIIFTAINIFQSSSLITDIQIANHIEISELRTISSEIERYEKNTNQTVETVVVYSAGYKGQRAFDRAHTNHPESYNSSHLITSAEWSNIPWLKKISGHNFKGQSKWMSESKEFKEIFPNYNEEQLSRFVPSERLKFESNTLYWITY